MANGHSSLTYHIVYLVFGFLYPAYASLHALDTPDKRDDSIWLIYWAVFATFSLLEFALDFIVYWFPLYSSFKIMFLMWCIAPLPHNGAFYIYKVFMEPFYHYYGGRMDDVISGMMDTVATVVPPYPKGEL